MQAPTDRKLGCGAGRRGGGGLGLKGSGQRDLLGKKVGAAALAQATSQTLKSRPFTSCTPPLIERAFLLTPFSSDLCIAMYPVALSLARLLCLCQKVKGLEVSSS